MLNDITMNRSANNSAACWCCINYDCVCFFNAQWSTHLITHNFLYVIVSVHTGKILSDFLSFSMHCTTCFISATVVCVCVCMCVCGILSATSAEAAELFVTSKRLPASFIYQRSMAWQHLIFISHWIWNMYFWSFFIDNFFAQYYNKGHCEKINWFLFWQVFLWLFSVLYGKAYFLFIYLWISELLK